MKFIVPLRLLPTFRGQKKPIFLLFDKTEFKYSTQLFHKKTSETFESTRVIYKKRIFK